MRWYRNALCFFAILLASLCARADVRSLVIPVDEEISAPRWMYDSSQKVANAKLVRELVEIKKARIAKNPRSCLAKANSAWNQAASLRPWLLLAKLDCALAVPSDLSLEAWERLLARVEQSPQVLIFGPQTARLRQAYVNAQLVLLETLVKSNRKRAWGVVDKVQQSREWLAKDQSAKLYLLAGELAFVEQNLNLAASFFLRSQKIKNSDELKAKIASLKKALGKDLEDSKAKDLETSVEQNDEGQTLGANPRLSESGVDASDEEKALFQRLQLSLEREDLMSAVEDGARLIKKFPGGDRARFATERMLESYLAVITKNDPQYGLLKNRMLRVLLSCDGSRQWAWAQTLYNRGFYSDALALSEKNLETSRGTPESTKVLRLAAKSAFNRGEYDKANKYFEELALEHAGTDPAAEAVFRLGLLSFRKGQYSEASAHFERLFVLPQVNDYKYMGLYWQWRAQQKLGVEKASDTANELISKYPLTYYGLRARAELNKNVLSLPARAKPQAKSSQARMWLTDQEGLALERILLLLKAGWFDEAKAELNLLPPPFGIEAKVYRARLVAAAFDYPSAFTLFNQIWDEDPSWIRPDTLRVAFPLEFTPAILKAATRQNLDPLLVRALIRQESSYQPNAISPAQALGVMQLLPSTVDEIAREGRTSKKLVYPDSLFDPETNIYFGSIYLSRLISRFNGHVPLALAAYNAGPGKLKRWQQARPDLQGLEGVKSSEPESELWIDELPWSETSFYVKAVLRNWLLYRVLQTKELKLGSPVWAGN